MMEMVVLSGNTFKHNPCAIYSTDVTFQQSTMPTGRMHQRSAYYSANHHLYGYKIEVSEIPNGPAINYSQHFPGNIADSEILRQNLTFHVMALRKTASEMTLVVSGRYADEYPYGRAVLADKGNQGSAADFRAITPQKK
jgi:hypothetical protein